MPGTAELRALAGERGYWIAGVEPLAGSSYRVRYVLAGGGVREPILSAAAFTPESLRQIGEGLARGAGRLPLTERRR
jgi:hypothetical protein